jgi:hypothetical protein
MHWLELKLANGAILGAWSALIAGSKVWRYANMMPMSVIKSLQDVYIKEAGPTRL